MTFIAIKGGLWNRVVWHSWSI